MAVTEKVSYTFSPETIAKVNDLAKLWSSAGPLPKSRVIAEAIDRAWKAETRRDKNSRKKSD